MKTGLEGKTVIVTGGASNIGRGIVLAFAEEASRIVIADVDVPQSNRVAESAALLGAGATLVLPVDVTKESQVEEMIGSALERFGKIDVLVNNVGWNAYCGFVEQSRHLIDKEIDLNLRSTLNCTKAVLPHMIQMGSGRIVNIGSESGLSGNPDDIVYSACKGGVIAFTKAVARSVGCHRITVNVVCPHAIMPLDIAESVGEKSMFHPVKGQFKGLDRAKPEDLQKAATRGHALPDMGTPQDIGKAVVFLASEAAGFITGQTLSVNGGNRM